MRSVRFRPKANISINVRPETRLISPGVFVSNSNSLSLYGLMLAMLATAQVSHATCWESGSGSTAVYRHPSVDAEFKEAPLVVTGRVIGERNISSPDDPKGYAWTIYTVQVLKTFKGRSAPSLRLVSENTSARFSMDMGKTYLLFVTHSRMSEMAGQERLPMDFVDNCGNSGLVSDAGAAMKAVGELSKAL